MTWGPNVRRLCAEKTAADAVPDGGGLQSAVEFLSSKEKLVSGAKAAIAWVELAIRAVREATEPNTWKNADDEAIAGELLRQIGIRKGAKWPEKKS